MDFICTNYANAAPFSSNHKYSPSQTHFHATALKRSKKRTILPTRVSNFAAASEAGGLVNGATVRRTLAATRESDGRASQLAKSSSALEQLDIERGVCLPFRKYSPETVRNKVLESRGAVLSLMLRGVEIVWNLGFYWSSLVYDYLVGRDEEVVPFRARQLRTLLCDLGPSFIKAGQALANRPDIIREDYMNELCILQEEFLLSPISSVWLDNGLGRFQHHRRGIGPTT